MLSITDFPPIKRLSFAFQNHTYTIYVQFFINWEYRSLSFGCRFVVSLPYHFADTKYV